MDGDVANDIIDRFMLALSTGRTVGPQESAEFGRALNRYRARIPIIAKLEKAEAIDGGDDRTRRPRTRS